MTDNARDAIIVGGGIVGCLTAYLLAREGLKVTLLEADSVGSHASGFAFGEMGALEGAGIPDPLLDFSVWSLRRHHGLSQEFKEASGVDNQFQFTNRLTLAFDEQSVTALKKNLTWQQDVEAFTVRWLDPEEVVKVEPMASPLSLGGMHVQNAASVESSTTDGGTSKPSSRARPPPGASRCRRRAASRMSATSRARSRPSPFRADS